MKKVRNKEEVRKEFLQKRALVTEPKRAYAEKKVSEHALYLEEIKRAQTVFLYASYREEVPTRELFLALKGAGKQIAFPKVRENEMEFYPVSSWEELVPGYRGILEPVSDEKQVVIPQRTDVCILPGTAFDKTGNRIGYGAGYYDRYLEGLADDIPVCVGLAYECQIAKGLLPVEKYDKKVQYLITEKRVFGTRSVSGTTPVAAKTWGDFFGKLFGTLLEAIMK